MFRLEVIGRFPTVMESQKYGIDPDSPVWLPTNEVILNTKVSNAMKNLSDWFLRGYKE